jgi:methyl-accepting chemotaxis protein WspA
MSNLTISRRMNITMAAVSFLLLLGVGILYLAGEFSANSSQRGDRLNQDKDRIYFDLMQMSDVTRGLLLSPGNDFERDRRAKVQKELRDKISEIRNEKDPEPNMIAALDRLDEFINAKLFPYYDDLLKEGSMAATNYPQTYPALRKENERLFTDFEVQVASEVAFEANNAQMFVSIAMIFILSIVVAVVLVLMRFTSSTVTEPLGRLVAGIERMRQGDFTQRLQEMRRDEFGVLGEGLNRLADDLSMLVGQVQRSGNQVNATATQIATAAREQAVTASDMAATTTRLGDTSKEISYTSQELVTTMSEVNAVAEETAKLAGSGQSAIERMGSTMRQIMDASGAVTAKLAILSEKTVNINSVVTTITKVADQTNLLSLNAAIEAEKAGEYGLGFSVVAIEIRRLADQTAVATYDIEKMVKEMQSAVASGVMGMDKFAEDVTRGVDEVRLVSTQLAQIIKQVQTLTPRFQTVNAGMHAQAAGAQQISGTLQQLGEAARQTAESLRRSNTAMEQLNEAARGLQNSVARFKLEV